MSFVLKQSDTYTWPIQLILPVDGGRREKHTFDGEFKRLPQSRINEIIKQARKMESVVTDEDDFLEDQAAAKEVLVGWSGVVDDDNKEIPFCHSPPGPDPTIASTVSIDDDECERR